MLWLALVGDSPQEPSALIGITENEAEHIRTHIHPIDAKGTKVSVVFCVCMYDCHFAVTIRPFAPFENGNDCAVANGVSHNCFPWGQ